MVSIIILLSINLLLHFFQNQILWVFFWRLSVLFGCWENERKFEENQMECEKGTNLFVWFETQVFPLSSVCKGGFWLRFLRKKAHTHIHTHTHINIHIHTHKHTHTHTHIHLYTYTHINIHLYTHLYTYTHIHTHIHIHTLIHTHTHNHFFFKTVGSFWLPRKWKKIWRESNGIWEGN